jgi:hypothetical protein
VVDGLTSQETQDQPAEGVIKPSGLTAFMSHQLSLEGFRGNLLVIIATVSFVGLVLVFHKSLELILSHKANPAWDPMQIMELYFAGAGAFLVVTVFKTVEGPMKFDTAVFGFQGFSGPIIMWVLVFLALCWGMTIIGFPHQIGVTQAPVQQQPPGATAVAPPSPPKPPAAPQP